MQWEGRSLPICEGDEFLYYVAFYAGEKQIYGFSASNFHGAISKRREFTRTELQPKENESVLENKEGVVFNPQTKSPHARR